ncbi:MAG: hypothetical protein WDO71_09795 [Bacteroidota bacterium]
MKNKIPLLACFISIVSFLSCNAQQDKQENALDSSLKGKGIACTRIKKFRAFSLAC